jgi:hypothetical protein
VVWPRVWVQGDRPAVGAGSVGDLTGGRPSWWPWGLSGRWAGHGRVRGTSAAEAAGGGAVGAVAGGGVPAAAGRLVPGLDRGPVAHRLSRRRRLPGVARGHLPVGLCPAPRIRVDRSRGVAAAARAAAGRAARRRRGAELSQAANSACAECLGQGSGQVSDPLSDSDERTRPGRDRAHRHREQHDQPMPDPTRLTRIDHLGKNNAQGRGEHGRIGSSTPPNCPAMAGMDNDADAGTVVFR